MNNNNMQTNNYEIVFCPHCNNAIQIFYNEINCKIYRHGIYKNSMKQIDPHLSKEECDRLVKNNLIYGCGKPFKINIRDNSIQLVKCGYI